jgi:hypothetical protein
MTPRQLKTLGELLYGRRWNTYLANDLGVDRRTVMCWFQKEWTMPAARARAVVGLASERIVAIRAALKGKGGTRASSSETKIRRTAVLLGQRVRHSQYEG